MTGRRLSLPALLQLSLLLLVTTSSVRAEEDVDHGPWFSHYSLTLEPGERSEAAGPFYYKQTRDTEKIVGYPPFYSHMTDDAIEAEEYDILYPLLTYDRYGSEYRWQFFQLWSHAGGKNQQDNLAKRFTIFPIYFQQRAPEPELNYTAFVPFYGHIKNRLFREHIYFVMFPAFSRTKKRDVITDNYFYPFYHKRTGNRLEGWQLWPFYGTEQKALTGKTNGFGDVEAIAGHEKKFIMWPFGISQTTGIGTENPKKEFAVLPIYSSVRSTNRDATTVIWPFFTKVEEREKKYTEWDFPWPLMVIARGEGKTITRFFPIYSKAYNAHVESSWYLWPVYKYNRIHSTPLDRDRTRILLFLYSVVNEKNEETKKSKGRTDLWPFFTHHRDFNGSTRLQVLAPLEPLLPNNKSIERDYSPLWSVWRAENNPSEGKSSKSLLWNVYRKQTTPNSRKVSLLFGLFRYESNGETEQRRLFGISLSRPQKNSDHVPEHR